MVQYGMPRHGLQKMVNTKLITNTNPLLQSIPISKPQVALPIRRLGAVRSRPLHSGQVGWLDSNTGPWNGFKATIWFMTIAGTTRGTIPWHLSAGLNTLPIIISTSLCHLYSFHFSIYIYINCSVTVVLRWGPTCQNYCDGILVAERPRLLTEEQRKLKNWNFVRVCVCVFSSFSFLLCQWFWCTLCAALFV